MPGFERLGSESWKEVAWKATEPWPWQDPEDTGAPEAKLSSKAQKRDASIRGKVWGTLF